MCFKKKTAGGGKAQFVFIRADNADGSVVQFAYDALGVRKSKTVTRNGTSVTVQFVTASFGGLSHVLAEFTTSPTSPTKSYIYAGHQQIAQMLGSGLEYLLHDGYVGSVTHAISATGAVTAQYNYDAFGTPLDTTIASYGYTGEEYDSETALLYLRARYYDPTLGRFISADPYWGSLEEPVTQNRYVYVKNNPLNYVDPTGLDSINFNVGIGFGPGVNFGVSIDTSTGDVYASGGIGVGIGLSGTSTYSTATPSEGYSWNFEGAAGLPGPIPAGGSVSASWDATAYSNTGHHQPSAAGNAGVGIGAGFSATGTFQGSWGIGNVGDSLNWWMEFFGFPPNAPTSNCP